MKQNMMKVGAVVRIRGWGDPDVSDGRKEGRRSGMGIMGMGMGIMGMGMG